jgi:uncharacterized protein YgbK (DUF1537 family)
MMNEIRIVGFADDATGAMDVAGSFHSRGYSAQVNLEEPLLVDDGVVAVTNLSSRYDIPEASTEKLATALQQSNIDEHSSLAFLKVDSTLRGNLAEDSSVMRRFSGGRPLFIAPAFPFYGRTCIDGVYFVKGKPILETEFAQDRKFQHGSSILGDSFDDTAHIGWQTLDGGIGAVIETVERSTKSAFTFDSRDQTDLEVIAGAGLALEASMIGSSGLARAFPKTESIGQEVTPVYDSLPALFIVGSLHKISRDQKHRLLKDNVASVDIQPYEIGNRQANRRLKPYILDCLLKDMPICLSTVDSAIDETNLQVKLEDTLGECAAILEVPHNLVIAGGETVRATLKARGIGSLLLRGEYEEGIPIAARSVHSRESIITKAGGFGHAETLSNIHNFIRRRSYV